MPFSPSPLSLSLPPSPSQLKFMWGNLAVASGDRWREVAVPFLQPGQVGVVSVALCAPALEGSYTSHWRLAHGGEQFGPRVWCSIVVDPLAPAAVMADGVLVSPCVTPQASPPTLLTLVLSGLLYNAVFLWKRW